MLAKLSLWQCLSFIKITVDQKTFSKQIQWCGKYWSWHSKVIMEAVSHDFIYLLLILKLKLKTTKFLFFFYCPVSNLELCTQLKCSAKVDSPPKKFNQFNLYNYFCNYKLSLSKISPQCIMPMWRPCWWCPIPHTWVCIIKAYENLIGGRGLFYGYCAKSLIWKGFQNWL